MHRETESYNPLSKLVIALKAGLLAVLETFGIDSALSDYR